MKEFGKNDDQWKSPNISKSGPCCLCFSELTIGCLEIQAAFFVYRFAVTNGCPRGIT